MARMHSRSRGKSGSKKPLRKVMPVWLRYSHKEAELIIAKLAKEGKNADVSEVPNLKYVKVRDICMQFGIKLK